MCSAGRCLLKGFVNFRDGLDTVARERVPAVPGIDPDHVAHSHFRDLEGVGGVSDACTATSSNLLCRKRTLSKAAYP